MPFGVRSKIQERVLTFSNSANIVDELNIPEILDIIHILDIPDILDKCDIIDILDLLDKRCCKKNLLF